MNHTRRGFLKASGGIMAASAVAATSGIVRAQAQGPKALGMVTEHTLPNLPYPYDALEPYIDAKTVELHHDKHHAAYVKGLNAAEAALAAARAADDLAMVQHWSRQASFHGAGHFLHSLLWPTMAPSGKGGGGEPSGLLAERIGRDFGSLKAFKDQFSASAKAVEGSGWCLLTYRPADDRLVVLQAENHQKLSPWNVVPILPIDVWEHAYYLKYQNKRDEYIAAWWNVVNWEQVAKDLDIARKV
jgi:Fe-Mn family superoxide dismutase